MNLLMKIFQILCMSHLYQRNSTSIQVGNTARNEYAVKLLILILLSTIVWFVPSYALKAAEEEVQDGNTYSAHNIFLPLISNEQSSEFELPSSLPESMFIFTTMWRFFSMRIVLMVNN